jgi:hypothetical protein
MDDTLSCPHPRMKALQISSVEDYEESQMKALLARNFLPNLKDLFWEASYSQIKKSFEHPTNILKSLTTLNLHNVSISDADIVGLLDHTPNLEALSICSYSSYKVIFKDEVWNRMMNQNIIP